MIDSRISAVLFDLDGTLLDTALDFETATNQLLVSEGLNPLSRGEISLHVTNGSIGIIKSLFNITVTDSPEFLRLQNQLLANYRLCMTEKTRLFPGLKSSLELVRQKQIPWGIVTNKPSEYAEPIVAAKTPDCAVLICPDHVKVAKPDPEGMFLATEKLGVKSENCIYVGDHRRDIDAGKAAGMDTVAVGWGYINHDEEDLNDWGATHIICEPADLLPVLNNYL